MRTNVAHFHIQFGAEEFWRGRKSLGLQEIKIKIKMSALCARNRLTTDRPQKKPPPNPQPPSGSGRKLLKRPGRVI